MSDYFDRIERQLVARVEASGRASRRSPRSWPAGRPGSPVGLLAPLIAAAVVIAVAALFLTTGTRRRIGSSPSAPDSTITFTAAPAVPHLALDRAIRESVTILRRRLAAVSGRLRVAQAGDQVVVTGASPATTPRILELAAPGRLTFFDWEASVLAPNGHPVSAQLAAGANATALTISQGAAAASPGAPQAGGLPLYDAVALAARQAAVPETNRLSRPYPQYYLFGLSPSAACTDAARAAGGAHAPRGHCLLAGPDPTLAALRSSLPRGVRLSDGSLRMVAPGTLVLQASSATALGALDLASPAARFFVVRDQRTPPGAELTNPRPSTDQSGAPDVTFGFTAIGGRAFTGITARVASRGSQLSTGASTLNQHFAIALDDRLLSVPSIDFKAYPEGIPAGGGADISGGFTARTARDLALLLRDGPLPAILSRAG